jgi:hypothetical protein
MPRYKIKISERLMQRFGDVWRFQVRGDGVLFEILCPNHELDQARIDSINEQFRNSLRYVKHYGGYPDATAKESDIHAAMNKLSSTEYGIGIMIKDDPLKEFSPFKL